MEVRLKEKPQKGRRLIHNRNHRQKRRSSSALFVCHSIQRADLEKNGYNAQIVNCGLMKSAQKVVLAMFVTIVTLNDSKTRIYK